MFMRHVCIQCVRTLSADIIRIIAEADTVGRADKYLE